MARKLELNSDQASILIAIVDISRATGVFSLTDIIDNWGISIRSIYRYHSEKHRAASREYARSAYLSYRKSIARGVCYRCHEDLTDHPRCPECTILLHNGEPTCGAWYCVGTGGASTLEEAINQLSPYEQAILEKAFEIA